MGDMIKVDIKNWDLKSGVSSRISVCPIFNLLGENSSIFKAMMGNGKF